MRNAAFCALSIVFMFASNSFATQLDLDSLGYFTEGTFYDKAANNYGWTPAAFTDGDVSTLGLDRGCDPYYNTDVTYTFKYTFYTPQKVDTLQFYLTYCETRPFETRIYTTIGVDERNESDQGGYVGWLVYEDIDAYVTEIHFLAPVLNRYSVSEVEMFEFPEPVTVPEPVTLISLLTACLSAWIKIKR